MDAIMTFLRSDKGKVAIRVMGCTFGIVGSLVVYGILQERLMTQPYGDEEEHFTWSVFLVLNNRVISCLLAGTILVTKRMSLNPGAPIYKYAAVSLSNVIATTCQYEALKYVSFPVQTLGKSAKMIPVMIWGKMISGKKYGMSDYLVAVGIMLGCTMFGMFGEISSKSSSSRGRDTSVYGLLLMCGYLGFDGFTSTFQEKLFKGYQMETYSQMLYVTMCSAVISLFWLFGDSSMGDAIAFIGRHPECMKDILLLSLSSTCGQVVILYTVKEFGALLFATIMTTRQFISILLSCIIFFHPLTLGQWVGTGFVFSALYYKTFVQKQKTDEKKKLQPSDDIPLMNSPKDLEAGK